MVVLCEVWRAIKGPENAPLVKDVHCAEITVLNEKRLGPAADIFQHLVRHQGRATNALSTARRVQLLGERQCDVALLEARLDRLVQYFCWLQGSSRYAMRL